MKIIATPTDDQITELIALSTDKAAKWIKDLDDDETYYWPSDTATHAEVALLMRVERYDKGIAISH